MEPGNFKLSGSRKKDNQSLDFFFLGGGGSLLVMIDMGGWRGANNTLVMSRPVFSHQTILRLARQSETE